MDTTVLDRDMAQAEQELRDGVVYDEKSNMKVSEKYVDQTGKSKEDVQTIQPSIDDSFPNSTGSTPTQLAYKNIVLQSDDVMPTFPGGDASFTQYLSSNLR